MILKDISMVETPKLIENIRENVIDVDSEDQIEKLVKDAINQNMDIVKVIDALSSGLDTVGNLYESKEYFLSELLISGDRAKKGIDLLKPFIAKEQDRFLGKIIFGSVKGDIHDIGKTIISAFLIGAGFVVYDLGVEVTADQFISAIQEHDADILAMSTLLTSCLEEMREVIKKLEEKGLRNKVKVIVGGRPVSKEFADEIGADAFAFYPQEAIQACKKLIQKK
ncbi:MAG: cobalamin B12-binding domain-containing protein [Candidatus Helarchaeota archaeon]